MVLNFFQILNLAEGKNEAFVFSGRRVAFRYIFTLIVCSTRYAVLRKYGVILVKQIRKLRSFFLESDGDYISYLHTQLFRCCVYSKQEATRSNYCSSKYASHMILSIIYLHCSLDSRLLEKGQVKNVLCIVKRLPLTLGVYLDYMDSW